jgi:hypothetical protein
LNDIFGNRDSFGRIGKWAMELSEHIIDFKKRNAIKSQVLADLTTDWTEPLTCHDMCIVMELGATPEQGLQQS